MDLKLKPRDLQKALENEPWKSMRSLRKNNDASVVPLILVMITIFICGALYSLFFLEIAFPLLGSYIPASDSKTLIMMGIYAIPLTVLVVGTAAAYLAALKKRTVYV